MDSDTTGGDSDVIKVSVSQEIRRFQEEINKVQAENVKFYQWKLKRYSLLSSNIKKKGQKRVSYCDAVTVFGSSESLVQCVRVKSEPDLNNNEEVVSDRNVVNSKENSDITRSSESSAEEENLVLPSVKNLATLFQDVKINKTQNNPTICQQPPLNKSSEVNLSPAMLTVKGQNNDSYLSQIHSITARTVPLEFREGIRRGKPVQTDSILRLQDVTI